MLSATCSSKTVPQKLGHCPNVGETERWASLLGGGLLAAHGLTRGSLFGLAVATVGAGLLFRGATGHCQLYDAFEINTAEKS